MRNHYAVLREYKGYVQFLTTMTVEEFNTDKGLYIFEFDDLETEFHSHPTVEIIVAKNGTFTLWTANETHTNLTFAVLAANQKHKLSSTDCKLKVLMIEHHNKLISDNLALVNIGFKNGCYVQHKPDKAQIIVDKIVQLIKNGQFAPEYDDRISATIDYLNKHDLEYGSMIKTLQTVTNLSESRLSHLFKSNIGISLKKYLIWTKLKSTIRQHLGSKDDLFSSLINSGFYDQPHFSRNFKNMLGVNPSKAYNSRNLQVLPITSL